MFSWLLGKDTSPESERAKVLYGTVRKALIQGGGDELGDDDVTVRIVAASAALLLCIAFADSDYAPEESRVLRETLSRIRALDRHGVDAIMSVLDDHKVLLTSAEATTYARELLSLTEADFRLQLLDVRWFHPLK